jgi:DNA-binding NarL/FixJ family response regulator
LFVEDDEYCIVSAPFGPRPGFSGLTKAEVEVAQMAVNGFSNRRIALARGSSERTVANQMASVLQKLGASSRVQIAARLGESHGAAGDDANERL